MLGSNPQASRKSRSQTGAAFKKPTNLISSSQFPLCSWVGWFFGDRNKDPCQPAGPTLASTHCILHTTEDEILYPNFGILSISTWAFHKLDPLYSSSAPSLSYNICVWTKFWTYSVADFVGILCIWNCLHLQSCVSISCMSPQSI